MSGLQTYRMVLAYDGGRYHGWQAQARVATVEGELHRALAQLTGERCRILAAGRTDAGAHAHGQVVAFTLGSDWSPARLSARCNAVLPADVKVLAAARAESDFHPRRQAWRRTYRYLVRDGAPSDPVGRGYEWRVPKPLELLPMRRAARMLLGRHDFAAFGSSPRPDGGTIRTVDRADLWRVGGLITLEVRADAFLRSMMRGFAGALAAVGAGRARPVQVAEALEAPSEFRGRWTAAPASGLHQWRVEYSPGTGGLAA